jgi:hypothetical protein
MGVLLQGYVGGYGLEVDSDLHVPVTLRTTALGSGGMHRVVLSSASGITATLGANSNVGSFRWMSSTYLAVITSIRIQAVVLSTITTSVPFDLSVFFARSFTVSDTGGSGAVGSQAMKVNPATPGSLLADLRVSTTAALTAGTRTLDTDPLARVVGASGTVIGNQFFSGVNPAPIFLRTLHTEYPIVLAANEGIVFQSPLAGPATGTFAIIYELNWIETTSY